MKLAFYKGKGSVFNTLIRFWTGGKYSHVELVFSDGVSFSSSNTEGGTRFKRIAYEPAKWDFVGVPAGADVEAVARGYAERLVGRRYDWAGIFGFVVPFWNHDESRWFCSEVCGFLLELAGLVDKFVEAKEDPVELYKRVRRMGWRLVDEQWQYAPPIRLAKRPAYPMPDAAHDFN